MIGRLRVLGVIALTRCIGILHGLGFLGRGRVLLVVIVALVALHGISVARGLLLVATAYGLAVRGCIFLVDRQEVCLLGIVLVLGKVNTGKIGIKRSILDLVVLGIGMGLEDPRGGIDDDFEKRVAETATGKQHA